MRLCGCGCGERVNHRHEHAGRPRGYVAPSHYRREYNRRRRMRRAIEREWKGT